jgi:hypothetical protein
MVIKTECTVATDLTAFTSEDGGRKGGMIYYQQLEGTEGVVPRIVTRATNSAWLLAEIEAGRIYIPTQNITCENS